jgi:hypothetical protein
MRTEWMKEVEKAPGAPGVQGVQRDQKDSVKGKRRGRRMGSGMADPGVRGVSGMGMGSEAVE